MSIDDACVWALQTAGGYEIVEPDPVVDEVPAEVDELTVIEADEAKPIRVHTLAKELDTTSADLLETLADHGRDISSASANVDAETADIMRELYEKGE
ncbi:translation initiation factor IF-2 N-terminal domain-containing protein [Rhodococcus globerulus]|uniref:translation initiation factor IF-2 N-terminal domain-containing protein n=1 Tax=Rhodococcus globerulus TaxID=33008 RepID=UPI001C5894C7|nr:translation initiation factor IF-2 N-terminal domain-containing protein [Rhodococcus globerulus]QXW03995.1 translation initiation factor IF-2 N-terminal domain-containing protein [Rhodococcus globerulus]